MVQQPVLLAFDWRQKLAVRITTFNNFSHLASDGVSLLDRAEHGTILLPLLMNNVQPSLFLEFIVILIALIARFVYSLETFVVDELATLAWRSFFGAYLSSERLRHAFTRVDLVAALVGVRLPLRHRFLADHLFVLALEHPFYILDTLRNELSNSPFTCVQVSE